MLLPFIFLPATNIISYKKEQRIFINKNIFQDVTMKFRTKLDKVKAQNKTFHNVAWEIRKDYLCS